MPDTNFDSAFAALTGNPPFPWQRALYERFLADRPDNVPASCNLPTGLGKTSVIAVWLIALANRPDKVPRRLVYVVNRRTVVDQTTTEVEKCRDNLVKTPVVADALWELCTLRPKEPDPKKDRPLAISTLRGQYADNREWSADPARPAVICGTVDMIGSRLLFSGYGCGFKTRPLHAGFLGQDALIVHDEAHLEPAFQDLLLAIEKEQGRCNDFRPLRVMELTATSRAGTGDVFELTPEEKSPPAELPEPTEPMHHVWQRMKSKKGVRFVAEKRSDVAKKIGHLARQRKDSNGAILVFVRTIDDVKTVRDTLTEKKVGVSADQVQTLTGTLRGLERDRLATEDAVFARFLPKPRVTGTEGTVYLICTSAGEVGVDISADHMVCDLTPLDSMAQRFGRVNRRGEGAAEIDVVVESDPDPKPKSPEYEAARSRTKAILDSLPNCDWIADRLDASPLALGNRFASGDPDRKKELDAERQAAFTPPPTVLPVSDILFDAWALTTIRDRLPGRPHVEPYLHGVGGWEPPATHVAWREEVWEFRTTDSEGKPRVPDPDERRDLAKRAEGTLEDYPLKPHELLGDRTDRVFKHLTAIAERQPHLVAWLVDDEGAVQVFTLGELADKDEKDRLNNQTVLLAPQAGGLRDGLLAGDATETAQLDVADQWFADEEKKVHRRLRLWNGDPLLEVMQKEMRQIRKVEFPSSEDEDVVSRTWYWLEQMTGDGEGSKASKHPVLWQVHTDDVVRNTKAIVEKLKHTLGDLGKALVVAAECHDLGKKRRVFQKVLGNTRYADGVVLAKSGQKGGRVEERYRHEFGSLADTENHAGFRAIESNDVKAFVLHVIATHHGRGRPHFPADEAFDPEPNGTDERATAAAVPQRFARLQRTYGRWGLAYLESLLRAADYAASASPSGYLKEGAK